MSSLKKRFESLVGQFEKKRIFITGAAGFVGQHLVPTLRELGATVGCYDHLPSPTADFEVQADLADTIRLFLALDHFKPEVVIHLAANLSRDRAVTQLSTSLKTNLLSTASLIEFAAQQKPSPRVILFGTAEEFGSQPGPFDESYALEPTSSYSFSKAAAANLAEMAARIWSVQSIILRPTVVYGPAQGEHMLIPQLIKCILTNESIQLTAGEQLRDFVYVDDLVEAICLTTIRDLPKFTTFNIASAESITIKSLVLRIQKLCSRTGKIEFGAIAYRDDENMDYRCSNKLARDVLGWRPHTPLELGLNQTIAALRSRLQQHA
jgi:nucleoside-diphosphate-sugar epimerase